ncbi:hypothetical protein R1flu_006165 [Riccia fluitans]|uniref:Uncharacterized protein n=1 Tax=Riccia fluitans TaxID=41844 RepID=A0ABD1YVU8_9MARC
MEWEASQCRIAELEDEEKRRGPKKQEDMQRIAELQQWVTDLVQEAEQYHTDEGLLAKVEREATWGDKLQEDLDRMKWQLKFCETKLSLLQEEKECAEASCLRMQLCTSTRHSVSM